MAKIKFYDVKTRKSVEVDEKSCTKTTYKRKTSKGTQERYALRCSYEGRKLTKFCKKDVFDKLDVAVEK